MGNSSLGLREAVLAAYMEKAAFASLCTLSPTNPGSGYQNVITSWSPWAYWPLQGSSSTSLADFAGNGRVLQLTGSGSMDFTTPGPVVSQGAVTFPDDPGVYGSTSDSIASVNGITFECWVYLTDLPANYCTLISQGDASTGSYSNEIGVSIRQDGYVELNVWNGSNVVITSSAPLELNKWHHVVAGVAYYGAMSIRVDKVTVATGSQKPSGNSHKIYVHGGLNAAGGQVAMANIAVYGTAPDDATTDSHYEAMFDAGEITTRQPVIWVDNGDGTAQSETIVFSVPNGTSLSYVGLWENESGGTAVEGLPYSVSSSTDDSLTSVYSLQLSVNIHGSD